MNKEMNKQTRTVTKKPKMKIHDSPVFHVINTVVLILTAFVCILPFINVLATAFSTAGQQINFWPKGFTWFNFKTVLTDVGFWRSLGVSLMVTVVGTTLSVLNHVRGGICALQAGFSHAPRHYDFLHYCYDLQRRHGAELHRCQRTGLTRSPWALILPSVVQVYNLILIKSYLEGIPKELEESAKIDGANNLQIMFRVMIPASMPCVASVSMFTAVTFWNNYTSALLYLGTEEKWYPAVALHPQLYPERSRRAQPDAGKHPEVQHRSGNDYLQHSAGPHDLSARAQVLHQGRHGRKRKGIRNV